MSRDWDTFLLSWKLPRRLSWSLEEQVYVWPVRAEVIVSRSQGLSLSTCESRVEPDAGKNIFSSATNMWSRDFAVTFQHSDFKIERVWSYLCF